MTRSAQVRDTDQVGHHEWLRACGPLECPLAADLRTGPAVARRG